MLTRIIMNRHIIASNKKHGVNEPPIAVKTYKSTIYCHEVEIIGTTRLVYDPTDSPCSGATAWIETDGQVLILR